LTREETGARERKTGIVIRVRNLQRRSKVDGRGLRAFLAGVAAEVGPKIASATLALVGDRRMHALNRLFRGINRSTDVLSFSAGPSILPEDDDYLGDIVISVETAERQAARHESTLHRELCVLALHGYLHLLGYDHETDEGEMKRIEYRLRRRLEITRGKKKTTLNARSVKKVKKK
jgi:probable rRNA maturation factor